MTEYQIAHVDGAYRVFATTDGIDREWRGPRWATPRQAIAYAELIVATPSPLRASSGVPSVAIVPTLPAGTVRPEGTPDARKDRVIGQSGG